jgi:trehalose-phosphatase
VDSVARDAEVALRSAVAALQPVVHEIPGALLEDKRYTLSLHYRKAPQDTVRTLRKTANDVAKQFDLRVTEGSCVLELRPPHAADKGRAVLRLANELGANTADASILFAGDDVTDEDAFRALRARLPHAVTISVGYRVASTAARYRLDDPEALRQVLAQLLARRIFFARGARP